LKGLEDCLAENSFMETAAEMVGLTIPAENADGVRANLERMREMAKPLMAYSIPDEVESASVFEPGVFEP
jgi:Protein of unknown function (DUF4089)